MATDLPSLMHSTGDSLSLLSSARELLAQVATIDEAKGIADKAEAVRVYYKKAGQSHEAQNSAAIVKLEAYRRIGELLDKMVRAQRGRPKGKGCTTQLLRLEDLGVEKTLAHRTQKLASIKPKDHDRYVRETVVAGGEVTMAGAMKVAKKNGSAAKKSAAQSANDDACTVDDLESLRGRQFATVYADPPWRYDNQATRASTDNHYATMTVEEICRLPISGLVADKALLFLWTTNGFLFESRAVIESWGFEFKSSMVWVKPQIGIGNYVRNAHEFLLIASRGGARTTEAARKQKSWVESDRTRHSRKPVVFREIVERISEPDRLELFGRELSAGWTVWGNQVSRQRLLSGA